MIGIVSVEIEEICVSENWPHAFIYVTIVDPFKEKMDGCVCCSVVAFD